MAVIADKGSAIGNLAIVLGNIIAPLIGGALVESYNWNTASEVMAFSAFCLFLFFTFFGIILRPKEIDDAKEVDEAKLVVDDITTE